MTPVTYVGVETVSQEDPEAHRGIYAWSLLAEDKEEEIRVEMEGQVLGMERDWH